MWSDPDEFRDDRTGAEFSGGGDYRYRLWRRWDLSKPTVAFIMLNPSTADAAELDPTCRRCKGFAESWGYGTLAVGNIFAYRATDPDEMMAAEAPIGPENDGHLRTIELAADMVVAAWGAHGGYMDRGREVAEFLDSPLYALGTTKAGHPVHPLYQPGDTEPEPFEYEDNA